MIFGQRFLLLLLFAGLYPSLLSAANPTEPVNIILITLDTTRADRMGFLGSHLGLTPNLDAIARESTVFTRAYAQVPLTTPSHAAILTGTYPQFNHLGDLGNALSKDTPYLPDLLHQQGYATAAFVGSQVLDPKGAAAPGFGRGFDTYDADFHSRAEGEDRYASEERRAATVIDHALHWIESQGRKPFFVWVHLYDPHDPYDAPEPYKSKYASAPYNGEIAYLDACLAKLFTALKGSGLYNSSVIAIAADHGEAFGEHGEQSHGFFLYDETIHVPLLIKRAGTRASGIQVSSRVGLADVAPTLLAAVGVQVPPSMQGISLLRMIKGDQSRSEDREEGRPIYSETNYPQRAFGWSWLRSWRAGKYLYVDAPHRELYEQSSDPKALHNVADSFPAVADTLQAQLDDLRRRTSAGESTEAPSLTPQQAEKLQALGYVMSAGSRAQDNGKRGPDPKDKIEIANQFHEALVAMDEEQYQSAVPQLQSVLKQEPELALANLELGRALNGLQQYTQAVPWLRKAVELDARSGRAHFELGVALGETGDWTGSATQLEKAVSQAPDSDDLHYYLARAYDNVGRAADAEKNFREALKINPQHYRANLFLGRLLGMQNNAAAALPFLQKAVALEPNSPDAHKFLANVYVELGDTAKARAEQSEAQRLQTAGH
jgi:choline-sulfatase